MMQRGPKKPPQQIWTACETGDVALIKEIFKTTPLTPKDATSLLIDSILGNDGIDVIRCLLELGACVEEIGVSFLSECTSLAIFQALAEQGMDFKSEGFKILEALNVLNNTAAIGDISLFDHLVSRGADISKCIALHNAALCPDPAKTKAMIHHLVNNYGFDLDADDNANGLRPYSPGRIMYNDAGPPLTFALTFRNMAAVHTLLECGADAKGDPNRVDYDFVGKAMEYMPSALGPLVEAGAEATEVLSYSLERNNFELARQCLRRGGDIEIALKRESASARITVTSEMRDLLEATLMES